MTLQELIAKLEKLASEQGQGGVGILVERPDDVYHVTGASWDDELEAVIIETAEKP